MLAGGAPDQAGAGEKLARAEDANRAKSDFLHHEPRYPNSHERDHGYDRPGNGPFGDQERVADCLQKISISSRHLLSLINDILDMSKIESSQITLNRMRISIHEMLGQLSAIMSSQARAAGLEFRIQVGGDCAPLLLGMCCGSIRS